MLANPWKNLPLIPSLITMTDLSPAAQAVLDAAFEPWEPCGCPSYIAAADLRALAEWVISPLPPPCEDFNEYEQGFLAAYVKYRSEILAIATELENV